MTGLTIAHEEAMRMARRILPLSLAAFGLCVLVGMPLRTAALSMALGTAYAILLFRMLALNAAKALLLTPEQATRLVRRGYVLRYTMTVGFVLAAIKLPPLHPIATVLPLFFPKLILLVSSIFPKKGG